MEWKYCQYYFHLHDKTFSQQMPTILYCGKNIHNSFHQIKLPEFVYANVSISDQVFKNKTNKQKIKTVLLWKTCNWILPHFPWFINYFNMTILDCILVLGMYNFVWVLKAGDSYLALSTSVTELVQRYDLSFFASICLSAKKRSKNADLLFD
jgi:hypothetical protein